MRYKIVKSQNDSEFTRLIGNEVNSNDQTVTDIDYRPMIMKGGSILYTALLTIQEGVEGRPMPSA